MVSIFALFWSSNNLLYYRHSYLEQLFVSVWIFLTEQSASPLSTELVLDKFMQIVQIIYFLFEFACLCHFDDRTWTFWLHKVETHLFVHLLLFLYLITIHSEFLVFLLSHLLLLNFPHNFHVKVFLIHKFINMVLCEVISEKLVIDCGAH